MSTDRELLKAAAKAAGIEVWPGREHLKDRLFRETAPHSSGLINGVEWNPLESSGDALELAVKRELEVRVFNGKAHAGGQDKFWCTETWFPDGDANAATRRAIVRAAAIGKASA